MLLPSRLTHTTLGDILGALHRSEISGVLELYELTPQASCHRIFLEQGLVVRVDSTAPAPVLGELLGLQQGQLHPAEAFNYGALLLKAGIADTEMIQAGLAEQTLIKLEALFRLSDAEIRFRVAVDSSERGVSRKPLTVEEALKNRPRARSDRSKAAQRPRFEAPTRTEAPASRRRPPVTHKQIIALRLLGLAPEASQEEIHQAFRALALANHPDSKGNSQAESKFAQLSEAYHFLTG